MEKIKVTSENSGERLDKFLLNYMAGLSRAKIQQAIKQGLITVNSKNVAPHYFLKEGDEIIISISTTEKFDSKDGKIRAKEMLCVMSYDLSDLIISKTKDYLVINKLAGIAVHGAPHIHETTVVDLILEKYPEVAKVGPDPDRPGVVHRLDKDVSGLMVIARSQNAFDGLSLQFKERTIEKKYIALVYGKMEKDEGIIDFPIERKTEGFKMAARPKGGEGKRAITEFKTIKTYFHYTLLELKIITGRTHQIRVHLNAFGHPIVGDNLYSTRKFRDKNRELGLGRIFLIATELSFTDLGGKRVKFKIDLPDELTALLKKIR